MQGSSSGCSWAARSVFQFCLAAAVLLLAPIAAAHGQSAEFDDWASFKPGSWCQIRTTTKTMNDQKAVTSQSVTNARYQVVENTGDTIKLRVAEGTVEYAGKVFPTPVATLVLRQYGRLEADKVQVAEQPKEVIDVGIDRVECRRLKAVLTGTDGSRETVWHFRDAAVNFPLRRVVHTFDAKGESIDTTTTDAWALNVPHRIGNELVPTTHYRTLYRNHKLTSTAVAVKSADVPGQLVHATIAERDASDRLLRYTVQELVAYDVPEKTPRVQMASTRRQERQDVREQRRDAAAEQREKQREVQEERRQTRRGRR